MFAAICEDPEFFKKHMGAFIAIAPVVRVCNLKSPMINKVKADEKAVKAVKMVGPEIMTRATSADPVSGIMANSFLGESISFHLTREISDEDPSLISKTAF